MSYTIRPVTPADRPILSRICLLTGDAGQSAEGQYHYPELLGLVYAEPYVVVPPWFGFVLVDSEDGNIIGYILGTLDTRAFEKNAGKQWYEGLRKKYTKDPYPQNSTEADKHMINLIHKPDTAPEEIISVSQAHIHIDLLPVAQGKGWGTRLIGKAVEYLRERGDDSLFVGIDSRNAGARSFYLAIGFESVTTPHGEYFRLGFDKWRY
ncbi:GCN5-related N-acetyltransferase [Rhizoctonia solani 123E]|uniref:GCN5-related N-acetyltransferase n=1 Tax=Rhizoctonia solani 123E TaxID=1423351 RepID=A0A074SLK3_9AGAM|nr:GCN5-related N-acetyltransferase [Rhizoctonia solani 123E]